MKLEIGRATAEMKDELRTNRTRIVGCREDCHATEIR